MNKQIKITLTEDNYIKLKELADKNYRTISQEVNYRIHQILTRPGGPDAPLSSPIYFPPGVRSPLPQEFIPHNTPGGLTIPTRTPENPEGTPIITCDTINNQRPKKRRPGN